MTATDELRHMLDERGVEWNDHGYENHTWWGEWHAENRPSVNGLFLKVEGIVTPEQAIAATLGAGTCRVTSEHVDIDGERMTDYSCGCLNQSGWGHNFCPNCGARVVEG